MFVKNDYNFRFVVLSFKYQIISFNYIPILIFIKNHISTDHAICEF